MDNNLKLATLGGGCFWCVEAVFQEVKGVYKVISGYSGGTVPGHPTYREICSGLTGHAEVIQLEYNPDEISYADIVIIFMTTHDPTTLNRQGADVGTQYRSVIFYHDAQQEKVAREVVSEVAKYYEAPIVTEISAAQTFYEATKEHQDYYRQNSSNGYCSFVITPKLSKLRQLHADKLK